MKEIASGSDSRPFEQLTCAICQLGVLLGLLHNKSSTRTEQKDNVTDLARLRLARTRFTTDNNRLIGCPCFERAIRPRRRRKDVRRESLEPWLRVLSYDVIRVDGKLCIPVTFVMVSRNNQLSRSKQRIAVGATYTILPQ